jgi:hypothetical protein
MVAVAHRSSDGDHWLSARHVIHLRLPEPGSQRFRVQLPEALRADGDVWEIEWLRLTVEDGLRTPRPLRVLSLDGVTEGR